jgi:hypothetical protein
VSLTSFAGLELIARFLRTLDFKDQLRRIQASLPAGDFGSCRWCCRSRLDSRLRRVVAVHDAVVLETTFHSWAIWSLLSGHGARIVVANSMQVMAIAHG